MKPMRICLGLALLALLLRSPLANAEEPFLYRARVAVPVADLRREPGEPGPTLEHDPLEESQLLYGDPVRVQEIRGGWARVAAVDQLEWTHNGQWEGYPGWVRLSDLVEEQKGWLFNLVVLAKIAQVRSAPNGRAAALLSLSLGTRLMGTSHGGWRKIRLLDGTAGWLREKEAREPGALNAADQFPAREEIVRLARLFLGDPYYWGGRSAHDPGAVGPPHTAVDCSGLVGLVHQAAGVQIPRDAHEQWMKARQIGREELQPADLLFLSDPEKPDRISHVALYAGDGKVIEGPGTGQRVREISLEEWLRQAGNRRVWFGSYLR